MCRPCQLRFSALKQHARVGISAGMPPETKTERLNLSLPASLLKSIDNWRRQQEDIPTRSEAARRLIEASLEPTPAPKRVGKP